MNKLWIVLESSLIWILKNRTVLKMFIICIESDILYIRLWHFITSHLMRYSRITEYITGRWNYKAWNFKTLCIHTVGEIGRKGKRTIVYTTAIIADNNKLYVSSYRAGTFHDANSWHEICCNKCRIHFIRVVLRYEIFTQIVRRER